MIGFVDHACGQPEHALLDAFERGELGGHRLQRNVSAFTPPPTRAWSCLPKS
jgi:hypothetical protein